MRGKKNSIITDVANELFSEETNKRAPMGFQGMRGKKALLDDEYYKRAPMGFQGMRGKKSVEEVSKQRACSFKNHSKKRGTKQRNITHISLLFHLFHLSPLRSFASSTFFDDS